MIEIDGKVYPHTRDMTPEEEQEFNISKVVTCEEKIINLKQDLCNSDYKAIKYAEGWLSEEEYAPLKAERQQKRAEINKLEAQMLEFFKN